MAMDLAPLERENMTARIYRELRQRILTGHLRPGEPITLRSLSESLGTSQTPVREALLQLVSERALTFSPGKSVHVPMLTAEQLLELRDIRIELESMAARVATRKAAPALAKELARLHKALMAARKQQDRDTVLRLNHEFHFALYRAAGMPLLATMIENLWIQTAPYLAFMYRPPFPAVSGEHPHAGIVAALQRHDAAGVAREVKRDIEGHGEILMNALRAEGIVK